MKLIDAISNVKRPIIETWENDPPIEALCNELGVETVWDEGLDQRIRKYPIVSWKCTDTQVGLYAIWMAGEPIAAYFQAYRRSEKRFYWISEEIADQVRNLLLSYTVWVNEISMIEDRMVEDFPQDSDANIFV